MANSLRIAVFGLAFRSVQLALLVVAGLLMVQGTAAAEAVNRRILVVYDSTFETTSAATLVHSKAEMPLNHLGYILDYVDATKPLPDPESLSGYAAVFTWFTYDVSRPGEYMAWARRAAGRGVPFIIFGQAGAPATPRYLSSINKLLGPMGIAYTTNFVEATGGTSVLVSDASAIGYERPLGAIFPSYPIIRRVAAHAGVLLEVQAPERERQVRSALVTAGPKGAFIPSGFNLYVDPSHGRTQWIVNPFTIFRKVLGASPFPVPDTTTVSGRRLYFSHVDGEGWNDDVEMDRYRKSKALAAEVMAKEFIEPYPDLPVTVGLIASDLDPAFGDGERAAAAARHILSLPQVEVASHSATSPLVWSFYENYSRAEEERLMAGTSDAGGSDNWLSAVGVAFGIVQTTSDIERNRALYLSGERALPRAYLRDPFSLGTEVLGAAKTANGLAPEGKQATVYTWTGDAMPFEAAVKASRLAGLRNINGGGSRFDTDHPSMSYVTPIGRQVGAERQIYAVDASDSGFVDDTKANFGAFSALKATLEATESPVRLKGVDLYYHAFAAKTPASLKAVRGHLDWARGADLAPITASQYAAIADGFFSTRLEQAGPARWLVSNRDGLQTVRFDNVAGRSVDIGNSTGVVGSTRYQGSIYVALDAAVPQALVSLRPAQAVDDTVADATLAQLDEANWMVRDVERETCRLSYSARGYGAPQFLWKDIAQGGYHIEAKFGTDVVWQAEVTVDGDETLKIEPPGLGMGPLDFTVSCVKPSPEKAS
ncbi:hypothetical protein ACSBOB_29670 [Mesorhizobium sp. ASY16-5R]|uniref:hypothetical protein n=1 Tax=Mesorhizobium sp. ASY16-5R TaxID=3445772 RepID=UPI003F9F101C